MTNDPKEQRARFTVLATLLVLMVLVPIGTVGAQWYTTNRERIEDNELAVKRERQARQESLARERKLRLQSDWVAYDSCVAGEARDAALVGALTQLIEPSQRPQAIIDLISALEPKDEQDCMIPAGPRPTDLP